MKPSITLNSGELSATGPYRIIIANKQINSRGGLYNTSGGPGEYAITISCTPDKLTPTLPESTSMASPEPASAIKPTSFLKVGANYDVYLPIGIQTVTVAAIQEDGWIQVIIDDRTGWLNPSQVPFIVQHNE